MLKKSKPVGTLIFVWLIFWSVAGVTYILHRLMTYIYYIAIAVGSSRKSLYILHTKRPEGSTYRAYPIGFYFRIDGNILIFSKAFIWFSAEPQKLHKLTASKTKYELKITWWKMGSLVPLLTTINTTSKLHGLKRIQFQNLLNTKIILSLRLKKAPTFFKINYKAGVAFICLCF